MTARRVPVMGRKIDLSGLTDNEAEHVLQVVQRDMRLRQNEQERLSELKQELDEEGSRCLLLSRQSCFNQRCCIRCCSSFTFLLNPKRQCCDCHYNICKACRVYNKQDKAWLCSACQKTRLLKTQSLEWFYANVKKRFKRFGSAKVLKTLYRKHLAEHSALSELTEGSAYEESICNEGSVCESDSTFYRQSEEHSMAETLTVALRVAEEAVDEAISKAEFDTASQEKQNEAHYLQEHRGELIEELAKTIVQKIISRRKTLAEMRAKYNQDWPFEQMRPRSSCDQASSSLKHQSGLSRSHSAFSLSAEDTPGMIQDSSKTLDKEGSGPTMSTWKSVDRLDNAGVSSVLKSPDGNWIALQSAQLSRPSLLTKRKSLVYSALERESGVVSAYEGMDSDNETKPELDSSWGAVLQEIHRKMTDSNLNLQDTQDWIPSTLMGRQSNKDELFSDPEGNWKSNKYLLAFLKRKLPAEIRRPSSFRRTSIIDVNFNTDGAGEEKHSGVCAEREVGRVRRSRKKRRSKKDKVAPSSGLDAHKDSDNTSDAVTPDTFTSGATTPEPLDHNCDITGHAANQTDEWLQQLAARASDFSDRGEELREERDEEQRMESRRGSQDQDEGNKIQWKMEIDMDEEGMEDEEGQEERDSEVDDEDMKDRLYRLVAQSRLTYFSSTDEELDKVGQGEAKWEEDRDMEEGNNEQNEGKTYGFSYRLSKLEKELQTTQFSSTEDELDRVAVDEQEDDEELGLKVCRLANQVDPTQFSSTEEELDTADRGKDEEEVMDEEALWKLQAEKAVQAVQLRDLACLVSTSQFSSTEDELDRLEENEGVRQEEVNGGGSESTDTKLLWGGGVERRESFGDLDVKMFDLRDGNESRDKKVTDDVLDSQTVIEDLKQEKTEVYEPGKADLLEGRLTGETEDDRIAVEELICGVNLGDEAKKANDKDVTQEIKLQTLELENQQERNWPDEKEGGEKFQMKWETTGDSTEEDAEFDRIISSMLMMTLEDMQVEAAENMRISRELEDGEAKDEERMEKVKVVGECRFKETVVGEKSPNNSEETGNVKELQRQGNTTPESAVREQTGHVSRNKERREAESRNGNEQEEKTRTLAKEKLGTNEAKDTCRQQEMDNEEPEDRRGKTVTVTAQTDNPKKEMEKKLEETERHPDDVEQSITSFLSPEEIQTRYSAMSLCSITTEVLKVLNATEDLLEGVEGGDRPQLPTTSLPPNSDPKKLDQQFSRLEENVYMAAGSVYSLEAELSDLEECAREICSSTSEMELSFLEEQVASAAAKVQQSELQIHDISARIAALKSAGLNVDTQKRFTKTRTIPVMPVTLDSSRQLRRRLPAPPVKEDKQT
ncbi:rab effector MyRIP isoform X2 [Channa argus]|uniref:rab effector MyRIP isoform X2 n=1 Tax=Channa argus TaxID=215402 RepID=UPI0035217E88